MALFDHLGISVQDVRRGISQFDPVMTALGCTRADVDPDEGACWYRGDEELILYPARDLDSPRHEHGRVGWQHLAFSVESRAEVDRLHGIAVEAGWTAVREPKPYPRYNERYYASFVEDDNGIRIEFMWNPPETPADG